MILVLTLVAALWFIGAATGAPKSARFAMIGVLYVAVVSLQVVMPDGHALRMATGESPALWLILGGFTAIIVAYRAVLLRLKSRIKTQEEPVKTELMGEVELGRYARHIMLHEVGGMGQARLKKARVLVVGAGGLGAPALQYLAAAGVGTIGIIDDDLVEGSNLQRQVIHTDARIGMPKVFSAQAAIEALNPFTNVRPYHRRLDADIAPELVAEYDLVLDGTDNFDTRYLINSVCVAAKVPLISGALSQWEGQLSVFDPATGGPCYRCIFPQAPADGMAPSCAEAGVIGPLPGVVGAMMAVEAVKVITGAGAALRGDMLIYDALYGETRKITLKARADCPDCQHLHA